MSLLDRHVAFLESLRGAGLPVSLSEGLDAVRAIDALRIDDRESVRAAYAATLVKRQPHRAAFDQIFDLYFPRAVGSGVVAADGADEGDEDGSGRDVSPEAEAADRQRGHGGLGDGPADLATFQDALVAALSQDDADLLASTAAEGVERFGRIRGRGPGEQRWSSYNVMNRVAPDTLVDRVLRGLLGEPSASDAATRRGVVRQVRLFEHLVEAEVSRRAAEVRGAAYVARHTVRKSVEQIDFTAARKTDLEQMRREIQPLARRLATRVSRQKHQRGRGPLDFRRTVRSSLGYGGVPIETHHRPRTPGRTDLVVLCDVSGSVANFASFTLMLVFALREQFHRVRAFTFVDEIHEVTDRFDVRADPGETMAALAASAHHASLWGRTSYGRAFGRFQEVYGDALTPRTNLLILGDARSNYTDLAIPTLRQMEYNARHAWWLNPESSRHWDTGDSAAREYGQVVSMVECRNLTQLAEFVEGLT